MSRSWLGQVMRSAVQTRVCTVSIEEQYGRNKEEERLTEIKKEIVVPLFGYVNLEVQTVKRLECFTIQQ